MSHDMSQHMCIHTLFLQDADEEVALEATEFWLAFCESDMCERDSGLELLQPVLNRLVPILMKNMVRDSSTVAVEQL